MSKALDNFTEGIKHLIQTAIDKAPFDKTYKGRVLSVANGEYTVLINGKEYPNTPVQGGGGFAVDEVVKVVFPQNNPNLRYIISEDNNTVLLAKIEALETLINGAVITGSYDVGAQTVALNFPVGVTDYFNYVYGLIQQGRDIRIEVDGVRTDWIAIFRHSKTSLAQGQDYLVFSNSEILDDYTTNSGFIVISHNSVEYVAADG